METLENISGHLKFACFTGHPHIFKIHLSLRNYRRCTAHNSLDLVAVFERSYSALAPMYASRAGLRPIFDTPKEPEEQNTPRRGQLRSKQQRPKRVGGCPEGLAINQIYGSWQKSHQKKNTCKTKFDFTCDLHNLFLRGR